MTEDSASVRASQLARTDQSVPRWRRRDLILGLVILALLMLTQTILYISGLWPDPNFGLKAEVYRFFPTVLTGYAVLWMARHRGMTLGDLGFNRHRILWPAFFAWAVAFVSGPLFLGLFALAAIRPAALGVFFIPAVFMLGVGMVIVAPIVEEITFRALLFRGFRQRWPLPLAALVSGFVFAAFHLSATTLIPLTLTGTAFAWAYARTGSIWAAILPHAGLNAIVFIVLVNRS